MSKSDKDDDLPRLESSALETNDQPDAARRAAMLVLTSGKSQATPDCGNPAWQLGLKRAGHSGC